MPANNRSGPLKLDSCKKAAVRAGRWVAPSQQKTEDNYSRPKTALVSQAWKLARVGESSPCQTSNNSALDRIWQTTKVGLLAVSTAVVPVVGALAQEPPVLREDHVLFKGTFDSGFEPEWAKELCCSHSARIVSTPGGRGGRAVKFTLNRTDPDIADSKRAEIKLDRVPAKSERIYRFSSYLPGDYATDPSMEIVAQWHETPDFEIGETWRSPPLYLKTQNGRWVLSRRWDPNRLTRNNTPAGTETIDLGPYRKGAWTDWVFRVRWSYDSNGLVEVWKDGKQVVKKIGPNTYNDEIGTYFKIGFYKPDWKSRPQESKTTQREIYFDRVRVEWF